MSSNKINFFQSKPPTYQNGSLFLGFRVPGSQTFTSYSPSSDMTANLQAITGLSGYEQRELLQSSVGTEILNQAANEKSSNSTKYLGFPGYGSSASCQQDSDCPSNQVCYTFNEQTFGPLQGPTCSPTVYPEVLLGNMYNNGVPLRQYSNYCRSDDDCSGVDEFSKKKKQGMSCNHYYKGPNQFEKTGLCQVQYESGGQRYHLKTPPGWTMPLNESLRECKTSSDCGDTGIDGWTRCVGGSSDGKKYCVWPGQTYTPNPKQLKGAIPAGMPPSNPPVGIQPLSSSQRQILNMKAEAASNPSTQTPGGTLTNVHLAQLPNPSELVYSQMEPFYSDPQPANIYKFKA